MDGRAKKSWMSASKSVFSCGPVSEKFMFMLLSFPDPQSWVAVAANCHTLIDAIGVTADDVVELIGHATRL